MFLEQQANDTESCWQRWGKHPAHEQQVGQQRGAGWPQALQGARGGGGLQEGEPRPPQK